MYDALDDDIARQVVPVNHPAPPAERPAQRPRDGGRRERAEKLARRVDALPGGRYQIVVTVGEAGLLDWSVMPLGKIERP